MGAGLRAYKQSPEYLEGMRCHDKWSGVSVLLAFFVAFIIIYLFTKYVKDWSDKKFIKEEKRYTKSYIIIPVIISMGAGYLVYSKSIEYFDNKFCY